jgi:hypothetical protein
VSREEFVSGAWNRDGIRHGIFQLEKWSGGHEGKDKCRENEKNGEECEKEEEKRREQY